MADGSTELSCLAQELLIAFVDMDSFEVQLYINKSHSEFRGQPCIVADSTGRIVSVSHEARSYGVSREMRAGQATIICPDLRVITKPTIWDKPDAATARHGSWAVFDSLQAFCSSGLNVVLEYNSSDGFYIDMTQEVEKRMTIRNNIRPTTAEKVFVEPCEVLANGTLIYTGCQSDDEKLKLMFAFDYITELVDHLSRETNIQCSVGISTNKLIAKYACQLHKPGGITVIPFPDLPHVSHKIQIKEIPGCGRNNGSIIMSKLGGISNLSQLYNIKLKYITRLLGPDVARMLYNGARGICHEPVIIKDVNNSVSSGKSFFGNDRLMTIQGLERNLEFRVGEMNERFIEEENRHFRKTDSIVLEISFLNSNSKHITRKLKFPIPGSNVSGKDLLLNMVQQVWDLMKFNQAMENESTICLTKLTLTAREWNKVDVKEEIQAQASAPPALDAIANPVPELWQSLGTVYQLRIKIQQIKPKIWRRIQIDQDSNFRQLHYAIQDAIGWQHVSTYEFDIIPNRVTIGLTNKFFDGIKEILSDKITPINLLLNHVGDKVIYHHGFPQDWKHTIILEAVLPKQPGISYPICIDGARAVPPPEVEHDLRAYKNLISQFKNPKQLEELHSKGLFIDFGPEVFNPSHVVFTTNDDDDDDDSEDEDDLSNLEDKDEEWSWRNRQLGFAFAPE